MRIVLRIVVVCCLAGSAAVALAQEITATPAPPKTPPSTVASNVISAAQPAPERQLPRAFSQDDMTVLLGNVQRPNGMLWYDGMLYAACNGDFTLYEIHPETGQTRALVFGVQNAHTLLAEPAGNTLDLWIPDFDQNQLLRVPGARETPRPVAGDLNGPWGIAQLDEERFLVSNIRTNELLTISREGQRELFMDGFRAPAGIALHNNTLYVVNNGSARRAIERVQLDENLRPVGQPQPFVSGLQSASGVVMGADGYLYFTYALGTRGIVGRVLPAACESGCTLDDVEVVVFTDLQAPLAGLTISPDMRLFVHTIFRPEIYWLDIYGTD